MGAAIAARLFKPWARDDGLEPQRRQGPRQRAEGRRLTRQLVAASNSYISILPMSNAVGAVGTRKCSRQRPGQALHRDEHRCGRTCRSELPRRCRKAGRFIECPVGGTIGPAKEGKLFGFAGGDAADVAHAKPLLDRKSGRSRGRPRPGLARRWRGVRTSARALCHRRSTSPARPLSASISDEVLLSWCDVDRDGSHQGLMPWRPTTAGDDGPALAVSTARVLPSRSAREDVHWVRAGQYFKFFIER